VHAWCQLRLPWVLRLQHTWLHRPHGARKISNSPARQIQKCKMMMSEACSVECFNF
jgi:hypothetical protein